MKLYVYETWCGHGFGNKFFALSVFGETWKITDTKEEMLEYAKHNKFELTWKR